MEESITTAVKMTRTEMGSPDGLNVFPYKEGQVYYIGDDLLKNFIEMGCVELFEEKATKPPRNKALKGAPENKGLKFDAKRENEI